MAQPALFPVPGGRIRSKDGMERRNKVMEGWDGRMGTSIYIEMEVEMGMMEMYVNTNIYR